MGSRGLQGTDIRKPTTALVWTTQPTVNRLNNSSLDLVFVDVIYLYMFSQIVIIIISNSNKTIRAIFKVWMEREEFIGLFGQYEGLQHHLISAN